MTQSQIVQALAEKCELTKKAAGTMMTTLAETAISQVKKNGIFVLPGIGRLVRVDRKARMGRNPATGAHQDPGQESRQVPGRQSS